MGSLKKALVEYIFVLFTVLVGLSLTGGLTLARHQAALQAVAEEFRVAAHDRISVITHTLQNTIAVSHSVVSFFQASNDVSREEFALFTSQILKENPYIEAVEWAPRVLRGQRRIYENAAHKVMPDFTFKDIMPDGELEVAQQRDIYHPVLYIEPVADYTKRVLGVDFMTDPVRRGAMEAAEVNQHTVVTPQIRLLSSHKPGILFFSPVVKEGNVLGFVVSAVPLHNIVAKAIEPLNKEGVNIILRDITDPDANHAPLFIHSSRLQPIADDEVMRLYHNSELRSEASFNVAGRKWHVTVVPSEGFFTVDNQNDIALFFAGVVFTFMLAYFMVARIRENIRITEIVEQRTEELHQLARRDPLTGLANRRLFLELLLQALSRAGRAGSKFAVIYMDLNDFKPVNDKLGHAAGDELLKQFGARINKLLRDSDTLARLGGDEFAILADAVNGPSDCEKLIDRLMPAIRTPYTIQDQEVKVGASIGIALYPDHAHRLDDILAAADTAMYAAKKDREKPFAFFVGK